MTDAAILSRRTVIGLIAAGLIGFVGMSYLLIFDKPLDPTRVAGPSAFSRSALGHGAFVELMRESGVTVLVSRFDSAARAGNALLVAAEPESREALETLLPAAGEPAPDAILVVLPKWHGEPAWENPRWVSSAELIDTAAVEEVLAALDPDARVIRRGDAAIAQAFGAPLALEGTQLIASRRLEPIVGDSSGMLVGTAVVDGVAVTVLSDPDLIANHGIGDAGNADFALALIESIRPWNGAVVIDETIHGLVQRPDLWRAMFELPFVLATVQALLALGLLVWASVGRFGPPLPADPPFERGAATLLDTGAGLMAPHRHGDYVLGRYADTAVQQVCERLHVPPNLGRTQRTAWLDRVGRARGAASSWRDVKAALDAASAARDRTGARLTAAARLLHRWKREMLHGP